MKIIDRLSPATFILKYNVQRGQNANKIVEELIVKIAFPVYVQRGSLEQFD